VNIVDANLLLYAHDTESPHHLPARRWLEDSLRGGDVVGLALTTILAFLRIGTNPRLLEHPYSVDEAIATVERWLEHPGVRIVGPSQDHWRMMERLARAGRARGPLMMDVHLAALAIEHGATLCSTDRDFTRFPRLKLHDPLGPPDV
jgi:hypothetical protein